MIITFTPNPSLDRTVTIGGELHPGDVHRIETDIIDPGGKGINVGLGTVRAGVDTVALFPAPSGDPLLSLLEREGLPYGATNTEAPVRTNLAIISAPAITTKVNEPGGGVSPAELEALIAGLLTRAQKGDRVMMCGSLAPQMPRDLYASLVRELRKKGVWVGVDTSDETLLALMDAGTDAAPDFLKPNAHELGQLTGLDGDDLEEKALAGDLSAVVAAAKNLREKGVQEVLVSLGPAGAVLVCGEGSWYSASPEVPVISTVGAGDSAVAGYLIGKEKGLDPQGRLALAVAYGSAAAAMPGTAIPTPEQARVFPELVTRL